MRYTPAGKQWVTLSVTTGGVWHIGDDPPLRALPHETWHQVRILVSEIMRPEELQSYLQAEINGAPRIGGRMIGLIQFHKWRWWQEAKEHEKEELPGN